MTVEPRIVLSRDSVIAFYDDAVQRAVGTAEQLDAPVGEAFVKALGALGPGAPRIALDLGYGLGLHTLALRRAGLAVVAVDRVRSDVLVERLAADSGPPVEVVRLALEDYRPDRMFGFVLARDVLHYLERPAVLALFDRLIAAAPAAAIHYFEVFADINRVDSMGRRVRIEGEAEFSTEGFIECIETAYRGWVLRLQRRGHAERDRRSGGEYNYFEATRVTVVARRQ